MPIPDNTTSQPSDHTNTRAQEHTLIDDANDFLMSGGIPSAKFPEVGATVTGRITQRPEVQQQRDFDTGELLTWDDGTPRKQVKVVLATDERDPEIPDDDGTRAVYVKANLQKAVQQALRKAGARLEVGGVLTITYVADGEVKRRGMNPPKLYVAEYVPPTAAAVDEALGQPAAPAAVPAAAPAAPAPAPAPAAAAPAAPAAPDLSAMSPEQIQALLQAAQAQQGS